MKRLFIILLILCITSGYAKDFHKTEEIIKNILSEDNNTNSSEKDTASETENRTEKKESDEQNNGNNNSATEEEPAKSKQTAMSGNDEIILKTGIQFFESGMFDHALTKFNEIISNYPSSKFIDSARMWAGRIYIRKYEYEKAISEFSNINEKTGEYPASLFYKGESLRLKGDSVAAIESYQKIASVFPDNELSDNSILITGKLYLNSGKGYQALESALRIVRYYKDTESIDDAYYLIAKIYEKDSALKDIEMSRKFYKTFLKKSDSGQKYFADSPLKNVVKKDLEFLEKTYFRLEK